MARSLFVPQSNFERSTSASKRETRVTRAEEFMRENYSRPGSKSLLPLGERFHEAESSRSVSLIRNLAYLSKS